MNKKVHLFLLTVIFAASFFTRFWQLKEPNLYYFDEIYYGFTAEQYALGNIDAWFYKAPPPKGFSYTWDHPPTGKLIMSLPIRIFGVSSLSRRLAPATFGFLLTILIYFIYIKLVNTPTNKIGGLLASFLITIEGIILSMSRIALVDIILTVFILLSAFLIWRRKTFLAGIFFGLAVSTKWSGLFLLGVFLFREVLFLDLNFLLKEGFAFIFKTLAKTLIFSLAALAIYLFSYTPFFVYYGFNKFVDLHKQMYWYHKNLLATHPFASKAYTWPLGLKPVWLYNQNSFGWVKNIYIIGNLPVLWGGVLAITFLLAKSIKHRSKLIIYLIFCYFVFWVPWVFSPRIMFLYHYLPSLPFLVILLSYFFERLVFKSKKFGIFIASLFLITSFAFFVHITPSLIGMQISKKRDENFLWRKIIDNMEKFLAF